MITLFKRLGTEFRTRGTIGFVRFIALRVVHWRGDVLYEFDLSRLATPDPAPDPIVVVNSHNFGSAGTAAVERGVLTAENHAYVVELQDQGQMLAATDGEGEVTSYAFVVFESFYKRILREADEVPIICNCVTRPEFRGQGLYPRVLRATCRHLAEQGFRRAVITCAPNNLASIRGIEKAGFRRVKTLYSLVLFARLIALQRTEWSSGASDSKTNA